MPRKIAPAIEAVLDWPIAPARMAKGAVNAVEVHCQARAELRALLAVARVVQSDVQGHWVDCDCDICRAVERLDRLSNPPRRRGEGKR